MSKKKVFVHPDLTYIVVFVNKAGERVRIAQAAPSEDHAALRAVVANPDLILRWVETP